MVCSYGFCRVLPASTNITAMTPDIVFHNIPPDSRPYHWHPNSSHLRMFGDFLSANIWKKPFDPYLESFFGLDLKVGMTTAGRENTSSTWILSIRNKGMRCQLSNVLDAMLYCLFLTSEPGKRSAVILKKPIIASHAPFSKSSNSSIQLSTQCHHLAALAKSIPQIAAR